MKASKHLTRGFHSQRLHDSSGWSDLVRAQFAGGPSVQSSQPSTGLLVDETPDRLRSQGTFASSLETLGECSVGRHATCNYSSLKTVRQLQVSQESFIIISRKKEMSETKRKQQQQRVAEEDMPPYLILVCDTHFRWKTTKSKPFVSAVVSCRCESHQRRQVVTGTMLVSC